MVNNGGHIYKKNYFSSILHSINYNLFNSLKSQVIDTFFCTPWHLDQDDTKRKRPILNAQSLCSLKEYYECLDNEQP